jgi:hypothetical protein
MGAEFIAMERVADSIDELNQMVGSKEWDDYAGGTNFKSLEVRK